MIVPTRHKKTIAALVAADPEVAQATCDIPHLAPSIYLVVGDPDDDELPYCGCFVGVYQWMPACKRGDEVDTHGDSPQIVAENTVTQWQNSGDLWYNIEGFAGWCCTEERDQAAVCYARSLLAAT